jgi:hypothetical protein
VGANLRHSNGLPVECVIADTCIGGVAEAAQAAEKFARLGVGVSLSVTPAWCYGSETMDMDPTLPKAVWGFNGTERPGAVYLAAVLAGHNQKGLPAITLMNECDYDYSTLGNHEFDYGQDVLEDRIANAEFNFVCANFEGNSRALKQIKPYSIFTTQDSIKILINFILYFNINIY